MESREVDLSGKLTILREVQVERRRLETCDSISESEDSAVTSKEVKCICPPTTKKERETETEIEVNFIANRIREELRGRGRSAPNEIFNRLRDRIFNQFREGRKIERSYRTDPWILFEAIGVQISDPISDQDGLASEKSDAAPVWINDEFWMKIVREELSKDQLKRVLFSRNQWDIWDFKIEKFKFQSSL